MPLVTVRSRPNGLPIATTGSPTSTFEESPSASGWSWSGGRVDLEQGDVGRRVGADDLRACRCVSEEPSLTSILLGAFDDVVVGERCGLRCRSGSRSRSRVAAAFGFAERVEAARVRFARFLLGFDEGDPLPVAAVDLVDDVRCRRLRLAATGAAQRRGDGRRSSSLPSASIQPAAIATQPKTATTAPPSRAEPKEVRKNRLLCSSASDDAGAPSALL